MTRIITPFGFHSTVAEVSGGVDLSGKRALDPVLADRLWDVSVGLLA
jgi:hypothetical protein